MWGQVDKNGNRLDPTSKKLKTRPCTKDDINFDGDDDQSKYLFYKPARAIQSDVNAFYHKLLCIDEQFSLQGNYNTASARVLKLEFEVCKSSEQLVCKDLETEIKPWMQRKFMFTLENRKVFQKTKVTSSKIEYESVITWRALSP